MVYRTKNACSNSPHILFFITILLYFGIVALHIAYIFTPIIKGNITSNPILYIIVGLYFALLLAIIYDYIWLAIHDPVDRIVCDPKLAQNIDRKWLQFCSLCGDRLLGSHHCSRCQRCTQGFDHHCLYLNNCIGSKNYQKFFRLLTMNVFFHACLIGQGIWVFLRAQQDIKIKQGIPNSYWVIIGLISASGILALIILYLLIFHCYISCKSQTTIDFLFDKAVDIHVKNIKSNSIQTQRNLK